MKNLFIIMLVLIVVTHARATSFQGLGDLAGGDFYSKAEDISADGSVVVGYGTRSDITYGFRWTKAAGMVALPGSYEYCVAHGVSSDGTVVVGRVEDSGGAFRWTQSGGFEILGDYSGLAYGVSGDGSVVVGHAYVHDFISQVWKGDSVIQPAPGVGFAAAASADGVVVVGVDGGSGFRWTESEGVTHKYPGWAWDISDDGSVVVGAGFYWTESGGLETLDGTAYGVSADGLVAVGQSSGGAFIWDQTNRMRDIKGLLEIGGLDLSGWTLSRANAIASDGLTVVGYGINPNGDTEAWIATVPVDVGSCACRGDLNDDHQIDLDDLQAVAGILLDGAPGAPGFIVPVEPGHCGDFNADGQVDLDDLQAVAGTLLDAGSPFIVPCE